MDWSIMKKISRRDFHKCTNSECLRSIFEIFLCWWHTKFSHSVSILVVHNGCFMKSPYLCNKQVSLFSDEQYVWLGGSDDSGVWRWENPTADMYFTDFSTGEPNKNADVNCLLFWNTDQGYKWADGPCTMTNRFICSKTV